MAMVRSRAGRRKLQIVVHAGGFDHAGHRLPSLHRVFGQLQKWLADRQGGSLLLQLHGLLGKEQLAGIPVLVLGNKNDLPTAMDVEELLCRCVL